MSNKANRTISHSIETITYDNVRKKIDDTGNALYREISGRDYGIDAVVELFEEGNITGKFALLQIKGTSKKIVPLQSGNEFSCKISSSNALYAYQDRIPVILIYASTQEEGNFFFADLRTVITQDQKQKINEGQDTITVRIPLNNSTQENIQPFFDIINSFYSE